MDDSNNPFSNFVRVSYKSKSDAPAGGRYLVSSVEKDIFLSLEGDDRGEGGWPRNETDPLDSPVCRALALMSSSQAVPLTPALSPQSGAREISYLQSNEFHPVFGAITPDKTRPPALKTLLPLNISLVFTLSRAQQQKIKQTTVLGVITLPGSAAARVFFLGGS